MSNTLLPPRRRALARTPRARGWTVVASQAVANLGFYAVVPFLTDHLAGGMGLSAALVGVVLGVRTAAQQGLFVVGGTLADRFGPRALGLAGCALRVLGFVLLGVGTNYPAVLVAAALTGLGGALFSPAFESTLTRVAGEEESGVGRRAWFARFAAVGETGALVGPALGGLLLGVSFLAVCLISAGLFLALGLLLGLAMPRHAPAQPRVAGSWRLALANRRFLAFAALYSGCLFTWNQLYFAMPLELSAHPDAVAVTALMFALASLVVAVLQIPVTRWIGESPLGTAIPLGFLVMAASMGVVPLGRELGAPPAAAVVAAAVVLAAGHMVAVPTALAAVAELAGTDPPGAYHGLLATCGGAAVLAGNALIGPLLTPAEHGVPAPGWAVLAAVPACCALGLRLLLRTDHHHRAHAGPRRAGAASRKENP
ncbi:MFS transporter [Rothia halotolerans]|uniref:MFS transporter n=1 Tax=Rothia halotolerans TaxID=405770 RepID=UPI00101B7F6C|nr:MFS transporter [Rothia halotolerans]